MKYRCLCPTVAVAILQPWILCAQQPFVLHDGTPVGLRLSRNISSADAKVGETVDFEVLEDVKIGETLVVARGGFALATVTRAQARGRMARGGKLDVNIDSLRLVNGEKVALRAVKETSGGGHTGAMTGGIVAASIIFFPAAPFFLFMHGKDITIPKGTPITAYVQGEIVLDPAKFPANAMSPKPETAAPPAPSLGAAMTNQDVLALKAAALSDNLVITKVKAAPGAYKLDTDELIRLKQAGISDAVLQAMFEAKARL